MQDSSKSIVSRDLAGDATRPRLALEGWALELARRWNSGSYSLFILHGNIFDLFPVPEDQGVRFGPLARFLSRRLFPNHRQLMFYNISDGLSFGTPGMQKAFFEWLANYDAVEGTSFLQSGPPREFARLAPLLRRYFQSAEAKPTGSMALFIEFPEKIIPQTGDAYASAEERTILVAMLKWATSPELRRADIGVVLISETAAELHEDIVRNPHVAQVRIDLPGLPERKQFIETEFPPNEGGSSTQVPLGPAELAERLSGLNLVRIQQLLAEAATSGAAVDAAWIAASKKRLIEEFCQGLVRFKQPKPGLGLDAVATHTKAKEKLREIAGLIRDGKRHVLERGILLPGRVGVGKSFLIDCFASECGLPVMELAEFRSKWVGDTELQLARILLTIKALGPVIVVVDEADAVLGGREQSSEDGGLSSRVFATLAAHLGDASLRGRELWIAMTSRPDLLAIDMKRQGRFGLCIPLFPSQNEEELLAIFKTVAEFKKTPLAQEWQATVLECLRGHPLTGSDVDAILTRALERSVLAGRGDAVEPADLREAVASFIDPLDPDLLAMQELAAVLACSDRRFLPPAYAQADRAEIRRRFEALKR